MRRSLFLLSLPLAIASPQILSSTTSTTSVTTSSVSSSQTPTFNAPARVAEASNSDVDESEKVPTLLDATGTPMHVEDAGDGEKIPGGIGAGSDGKGSGVGRLGVGTGSFAALVVFCAILIGM